MMANKIFDDKSSKTLKTKPATGIICFFCLLILYSVASTVLNRISPLDTLKFILFQLASVVIPGIDLLILFKIKKTGTIKLIAFGYAFGYTLNILLYMAIMLCGLKDYTMLIVLIYSFIAVMFLARYYARSRKSSVEGNGWLCIDRDELRNIIIVSLCLFTVQFLLQGLGNQLPITGGRTYQNDMMYWEGNIVSLTKSFPPMNVRRYGSGYGYHYFSSLQMALINMTTGINVATLGGCFSFIQAHFMLLFSAFALFSTVLKSKKKEQ